MSSPSARDVIVDDTDSSMIFEGTWSYDQGVTPGTFATAQTTMIKGAAFNNTSTFTENDSSLTFAFNGTAIYIEGGINFLQPEDGTWGRCYVDGIESDGSNPDGIFLDNTVMGTNNNILCSTSGLPDGPHVLTVNFTNMGNFLQEGNDPNRVWIDHLVYTPGASVAIDSVPGVIVQPNDPQLIYSSGWANNSDGIPITQQQNASVTFTFHGTAIDYYGTLTDDPSTENLMATYVIDEEAPTVFSVIPFSTGNILNKTPLIQLKDLPSGQHTLTVIHLDGSTPSTVPLSLTGIVFQPSPLDPIESTSPATNEPGDDTEPTSTSSSPEVTTTPTLLPPAATATASGIPSSNTSHKNSTIIMAGVIAGTAMGLCLILCVIFIVRRRRNKQNFYPRTSVLRSEIDYADRARHTTPSPPPVYQQHSNASSATAMVRSSDGYGSTAAFNLSRIQTCEEDYSDVYQPSNEAQNSSLRRTPIPILSSKKKYGGDDHFQPDIILTHDDSGMRLPQPGADTPPPRIVEYPPSYAP